MQQEYEKAVADKNARVAEIKRLDGKIIQKDMEIKRVEDNVLLCKQRKAFLDELAVSAGKKSLNNVSKSFDNRQKGKLKEVKHEKKKDGFFMTQMH